MISFQDGDAVRIAIDQPSSKVLNQLLEQFEEEIDRGLNQDAIFDRLDRYLKKCKEYAQQESPAIRSVHEVQFVCELCKAVLEREYTGQNARLRLYEQLRVHLVGYETIVDHAFNCIEPVRESDLIDGFVSLEGYDKVHRKPLGKGSFAVAWLVLNKATQRNEVLRHLLPSCLEDEMVKEAFLNEQVAIAKINFKSDRSFVRQIYRAEEDKNGTPVQFLEYIDGVTLRQYLDVPNRHLTYIEVMKFAEQLAAAAQAIHSAGYVHQDLKPENIILKDGVLHNIRICDLGLALYMDERIQRQGIFAGTLAYSAPEQISRSALRTDARADIWSIGVILYEMLLGLPFKSTNRYELEQEILAGSVIPIRQRVDIPKELDDCIMRCLQVDRETRFQSARDLLEHLHSIQSAELTTKSKVFESTKAILRPLLQIGLYNLCLIISVLLVLGYEVLAYDSERILPTNLRFLYFGRAFGASVALLGIYPLLSFFFPGGHLHRFFKGHYHDVVSLIIVMGILYSFVFIYTFKLKSWRSNKELRVLLLAYTNVSSKKISLDPTIYERVKATLSKVEYPHPIKILQRSINVERSDTETAKRFAYEYGAPIVIWGAYDDKAFFTRMRDLEVEFHDKAINPIVKPAATYYFNENKLDKFRNIELSSPHEEVPSQVEAGLNLVLASRIVNVDGKCRYLTRARDLLSRFAGSDLSMITGQLMILESNSGNFDVAYRYATEQLKLSNDANAYLNRAQICIGNKEFELAKADIATAKDLGGDPFSHKFVIARLHEDSGELSKAIEEYEELVAEENNHCQVPFVLNNLANCLWTESKDLVRARSLFDRAIESGPGAGLFRRNRARFELDMYLRDSASRKLDIDGIIADCERAIELEPEELTNIHTKIAVYLLSDRVALAAKEVERLDSVHGDVSIPGDLMRGLTFARSNPARATEAFRKAAKSLASDFSRHSTVKNAIWSMLLRAASQEKLAEKYPMVWALLGAYHAAWGNHDGASGCFLRALMSIDGDDKALVQSLIRVLPV